MSRYLIFLILPFFFVSCDKLEFNPNQKFDKDTPREINQSNLRRLMEDAGDDTIRFVLTGDTQRGYGEARSFVKKANALNGIDFVVIAGDISDFGLLQEMEWVAGIFNDLKMPYLGVIGNHDLTANGNEVFQRVFGELDYSFVYQGVKFLCTNTNSRESGFDGSVPDIGWLKEQVKPSADFTHTVVISHVPPNSADFDPLLHEPFVSAISEHGNTLASLHAHDHVYSSETPYENGIPFIVSAAILKKEFVVITIVNGELEEEVISY